MAEPSPSWRPSLTWVAKFCLHVSTYFVAFLVAYELRRALSLEWWLQHPDALRVVGWAVLYAAIGGVVEALFRTERSAWRFASVREVLSLARSVTVAIAVFMITIFVIDRGLQLPRSVPILAWLVSLLLLVGVRVAWRLRYDASLLHLLAPAWWPTKASGKTPLVVIGSMDAADRQIRVILADPNSRYQPIEIVTPNASEIGLQLHGLPFHKTLETWKADRGAGSRFGDEPYAVLFLEDPVLSFGMEPSHIGELRRAGHVLLRPQSLVALNGQATPDLREIPLEEFLPRKPINLDPAPLRALFRGRRCLVTGAGGSIGSEVARQLLALGCGHLTLVDHSEFLLFEIDRELSHVQANGSRRAVLANVRDPLRIAEIFAEEKPDIVFHAAALKHVALVENNPVEGVLTNVLGTWNVIRSAIDAGARQFVLISTDKAVGPSNVMGATKRVAESLLDLAPSNGLRLSAVRFGNVLGSAGSVVPIFRDQIARGGPVTVTHPDVDRYFMTIPEAVQLVLHSTAINAARPTPKPTKFLLEMGQPVKIVDLARQMITLMGKTPDVDIPIVFTGLKPGEKMSEVLSSKHERVTRCGEGITEIFWAREGQFLSENEGQQLVRALQKGDATHLMGVVRKVMADAQSEGEVEPVD